MSVGEREKSTQDRIIKLFVSELGYTYLGKYTDRPNNANIEQEYLRTFLKKQGHSDIQLGKAIRELVNTAGNQQVSLYDLNKATYALLRYGAKVSENVGQHKTTVQFVNWNEPLNNDFYIAEEVTYIGKQRKIRTWFCMSMVLPLV